MLLESCHRPAGQLVRLRSAGTPTARKISEKWAPLFILFFGGRRPMGQGRETIVPRLSIHLRLSLLPYSAKEILWLINILRAS